MRVGKWRKDQIMITELHRNSNVLEVTKLKIKYAINNAKGNIASQ